MSAAREKIEKARKELVDNKDFSEVAKSFLTGERKNSGDLGWLSMHQMIPEIAVAAALEQERAK
jgi:hypothetical protein